MGYAGQGRTNRVSNNSLKATIMHKVLINFAVVSQIMAQSGALLTMAAPGSWGFVGVFLKKMIYLFIFLHFIY